MPLDPQIQAMRDRRAAAGTPQLYTQTLQEARAADLASIRAEAGEPEAVYEVVDTVLPGRGGELPVRLYRPSGDGPLPVLLYYFGGGWVLGSIDTSDALCRALANAAGCLVVTVGYRLAPEHQFPAAIEDSHAALLWVVEHAEELGADATRIAVAGDSAGGNLAAAVSLLARDGGGPALAGQVLVYPNTDQTAEGGSMAENDDPYLFNKHSVAWYRQFYLANPEDALDPLASPLKAPDLSGLPPALVITAEYDPLRDQGEEYARRMAESGVATELRRFDGMAHGFYTSTGTVDAAGEALALTASTLRGWFAEDGGGRAASPDREGPATYPMTIGQLSVYRDIQTMGERIWEANLPFQWDIRTECTVEDVWAALGRLAMRHESLRTNYLVDEDGGCRQFVAFHTAEEVLAKVGRGLANVADLATVVPQQYQTNLDVHKDVPWRACVFTDDAGVPKTVVFIANHITADGAASLILQNDFAALLAGEELAPPTWQPIALAQNQQGAGAARLRAAERYWRRTLESATRRTKPIPVDDPTTGATLHTGIPLALAHEAAAALGVSVATLVLAAYYAALRKVTGDDRIMITQISHNRFDSDTAGLVTSMNQWAAMVLDADESDMGELCAKLQGKAFSALKNGICDPDYLVRLREEMFELADPPVDPGFNLNIILAPPNVAPPAEREAPSKEFYEPDRNFGAVFYMIVRGIEKIDVLIRTRRPEFDRERLEALLDEFQTGLETALVVAAARG
jgi:acetyl esterase